MTQEEAIKVIKKCKEKGFKYTFYTVNEYDTALDMAIKALRREDTFLNKVLEIIDEDIGEHIYRDAFKSREDLTKLYNRVRSHIEGLKGGEQE